MFTLPWRFLEPLVLNNQNANFKGPFYLLNSVDDKKKKVFEKRQQSLCCPANGKTPLFSRLRTMNSNVAPSWWVLLIIRFYLTDGELNNCSRCYETFSHYLSSSTTNMSTGFPFVFWPHGLVCMVCHKAWSLLIIGNYMLNCIFLQSLK